MALATAKQINYLNDLMIEVKADAKNEKDSDLIKFYEIVAFNPEMTKQQASWLISLAKRGRSDSFIFGLELYIKDGILTAFDERTQTFLNIFFDGERKDYDEVVAEFEATQQQDTTEQREEMLKAIQSTFRGIEVNHLARDWYLASVPQDELLFGADHTTSTSQVISAMEDAIKTHENQIESGRIRRMNPATNLSNEYALLEKFKSIYS